MPFAEVPLESRSQIDNAGRIVALKEGNKEDEKLAKDLINKWRSAHAYPLNTFQATLRKYCGDFKEALTAQRLKRMPTIIDKLRRYPDMKLSRMQDIGGLRAILKDMQDVEMLAKKYKENKKFPHELIMEKNYIKNPRDEDGYRSWHLIYKYKNKKNPMYDGLRLEIQIRTRLQHLWATAVETMGTFLGQALKSRQGEQIWLDFFCIISSAFAYKERMPPVPKHSNLSEIEIFKNVKEIENQIQALSKMKGLSVAIDHIKGGFCHLIVLNSLDKTVEVSSYRKNDFDKALLDYAKKEEEAEEGKKIEPVLVVINSVNKIRQAYPNFFLDIEDFSKEVKKLIGKAEPNTLKRIFLNKALKNFH